MSEKKNLDLANNEQIARLMEGFSSTSRETERNRAMYLGMAAFDGSQPLAQKDKLILFATGGVHLAVALEEVAEVLHAPAVTRLPRLPSWVLGIANVRSEIVSVINLPEFFGWQPEIRGADNKIIILQREKLKVGVLVSAVVGTMTRADELELVAEVPETDSPASSCLLGGIVHGEQVYTFLDVHALLGNRQLLLDA